MASLAPDTPRRKALRAIQAVFAEAGLAEAATDARILVEDATGASRTALLLDGDAPLGEAAAARLAAWWRAASPASRCSASLGSGRSGALRSA